MRKLLLTTALAAALTSSAYAGVVITNPGDCVDGFCLVSPDKDDLKMFIDKPKDKTSTTIFGSVGTNDNGLKDVQIDGSNLVTDGSGFANIKPAKDTILESVLFTPNVSLGQDFDGFFVRVQLQDNYSCKKSKDGPACAPDESVPEFFVTVNGTDTFGFNNGGFNKDGPSSGFDELVDPGTLITSVKVWVDTSVDPYVSFKELKQIQWSPVGATTGGAPEPSTWAMGLVGFGMIGMLGLYRTRKGPIRIEV